MATRVCNRLISLDIFRGLTIAAMIVVNNLVAWTDTPRFPRLTHAEWHGCTLVDLIFPFFIFIVGVTAVFSLEQRAKNGDKSGAIVPAYPRSQRRAFRSGSGGVQLFFLGLAIPGHLSTRSDSGEYLGDFPVDAGQYR